LKTVQKNTKRRCAQHGHILGRCPACAANGVCGAGTELCMLAGHFTRTGVSPRKDQCARCRQEKLRVPLPKKCKCEPDAECELLICDLANAYGNTAGKGFEVKKRNVSRAHGYNALTGPVVQAVKSNTQYIEMTDVLRPTDDMTLSAGTPKGRCGHCARPPDHPCFAQKLPALSAPAGRTANWAVGTICFEPDNYEDVHVPRTIRPGRLESDECACAWQYDTTNLKRLFYFWRPRNGEKHTTIAFLAHHAWTTSRGRLMDAGDPDAGYLRAHRIVSKTRFTQMQAWSTPSKFRQCPLRRGARRDAWPS